MNTIIGIFDNAMDARRAMEALRDGPIMIEDISVISKDNTDRNSEDVSAGEGAAVGAVWGGLVGLTALLIPGIGPFIAIGALGAALTGAGIGAVVGGIAAALIDFSGIPEDEARGYESEISAGKTLVAVKANNEDAAAIRQVLSSGGASSVRGDTAADSTSAMASPPARVMMYDDKGQRVEQAVAVGQSSYPRGIYDYPTAGATQSDQSWTSGEVVGEGQGAGRRTDTGTFDADQWVGEGQGPGKTPGASWTSGEVVGEGQGEGRRTDTGEYDSRQWVGEGQGDDTPAKGSDKPSI